MHLLPGYTVKIMDFFRPDEIILILLVIMAAILVKRLLLKKKAGNKPHQYLEGSGKNITLYNQFFGNKALYEALFDNLPQRIFLKDTNSVFISCNKRFADDLQIEPRDISGKTDFDIFQARQAEKCRSTDQQVISSRQNLTYEDEYFLLKNKRIINITKIPIMDEQGNVSQVLGIFDDITKDKQTALALLEREEQFRTLVQQAGDAIMLADMKGKIIDANLKTCESLGYTRNELLNLHMMSIDPVIWSRDNPPELWKKLGTGQPVIYESRYYRKDGSTFLVEISMGLLQMAGRNLILSTARDITPRHLALKRSASLGQIVEDSSGEIYILSRDSFMFVQVNRGARKNIQYSADELRARNLLEIAPELTRSALRRLTAGIHKGTQDRITFETVFIRKDRSSYPVEIHLQQAEYLYKPVYVLYVQDLTRRKEAESELKRAFDIINTSSSVAIIWDNEQGWPVRFVSNNVEKILKYPVDDFLSRRLRYSMVIHPGDIDRVEQEINTAAANKEQNIVEHQPYRVVTGDGGVRWVAVQTYITRDSNQSALSFQGILEDISVLKEQEIALRIKQEEWERTFNAIPDIVTLLDMNLQVTRINKAGSILLGLAPDNIIGRSCYDLFRGSTLICPECPVLESFKTFQPRTREIYHKKLDKTFLVSTSPVLNDKNEIIYIVHVAKDISERKMLEKQLFMSEKMATIAGLAAGVAHEINTPLSAILQSLHVIQHALDDNNPENRATAEKYGITIEKLNQYLKHMEIHYFLGGIRESAMNASKIINSLLDFSRPRKRDRIESDLHELVESSLNLARADYDLKKKYDILNVDVIKEFADDLPRIYCVPMEIEQVILNLLKNAVHAMTDNPDQRDKPRITIRTYRNNTDVFLEVEDNGPGIKPEIIKNIFDPFFTTKDIGVGTGLGLSVSYTISNENHMGNIWVESDFGKGTTLKLRLPIKSEMESALDVE